MWELVATIAVQTLAAAVCYGMLIQRVRDHDRRLAYVETKIDKWQEEGFPVTVRNKAHTAHGGL